MRLHCVVTSTLAALVTIGLSGCHPKRPSPGTASPSIRRVAPTRPGDLIALLHLGQPRRTAASLSRWTGQAIPVDLTLALIAGVDVSVLASVETNRPIEMVLVGTTTHPGIGIAMTPASAARMRSALTPRYTFVTVPGLGERLETRGDPGLSGMQRLSCAVIAVPGPIAARMVCASDTPTLVAMGRWLAWRSDAEGGNVSDVDLRVEGDALRRVGLPALHAAILRGAQEIAESAAAARRSHERPPDLGDPEAAAGIVQAMGASVAAALSDVVQAQIHATIHDDAVLLAATLSLPLEGTSALAQDARERLGAATEHPLAAMLPPDARLAVATRGVDAGHAVLTAVIEAGLRVLGVRVGDPTTARADCTALGARLGDEAAVGIAPDAPRGVEVTAVLSQSDGGTAARAALVRMGSARWFRSLRLGGPVQIVHSPHGTLVLTLPPSHDPLPADPGPPESLALGIRQGALGMIVGRHARMSLDAMTARGSGPPPSVLGNETGSLIAGLRPGTVPPTDDGDRVDIRYDARREGTAVIATGTARVPDAAAHALARWLGGR